MILDTSGIGPGHFRIWKRGVCPHSEAHEGGRRSAIWPPLGPEVVLWELGGGLGGVVVVSGVVGSGFGLPGSGFRLPETQEGNDRGG